MNHKEWVDAHPPSKPCTIEHLVAQTWVCSNCGWQMEATPGLGELLVKPVAIENITTSLQLAKVINDEYQSDFDSSYANPAFIAEMIDDLYRDTTAKAEAFDRLTAAKTRQGTGDKLTESEMIEIIVGGDLAIDRLEAEVKILRDACAASVEWVRTHKTFWKGNAKLVILNPSEVRDGEESANFFADALAKYLEPTLQRPFIDSLLTPKAAMADELAKLLTDIRKAYMGTMNTTMADLIENDARTLLAKYTTLTANATPNKPMQV